MRQDQSYESMNQTTASVNPLIYQRYSEEWSSLYAICQAQKESKEVVLRMEHFPPCPLFSSRAGAGTNGYAQFKNVAAVLPKGKSVYMHRAAAMFRAYEQLGLTHEEMTAFEVGKEASHLLVTPPNHSE